MRIRRKKERNCACYAAAPFRLLDVCRLPIECVINTEMAFRALLLVSVGVQELKGIYQALLISHEKEGAPTRAINTRFIQPTYKSMMKIEFGRRVLQWGVSLSLSSTLTRKLPGAHEPLSLSLTHSLTGYL